jgi:hypothetical protein
LFEDKLTNDKQQLKNKMVLFGEDIIPQNYVMGQDFLLKKITEVTTHLSLSILSFPLNYVSP